MQRYEGDGDRKRVTSKSKSKETAKAMDGWMDVRCAQTRSAECPSRSHITSGGVAQKYTLEQHRCQGQEQELMHDASSD
jgi:hypothetical protein